MLECFSMKKHALSRAFFILLLALPYTAPAQRLPESCQDSTPSLKECYASYFMLGASSCVDGLEEERIKEKEKEDKKKAKEDKKKAKKAEKARKKAEKVREKQRKKRNREGESLDDDYYDDYDYYDEYDLEEGEEGEDLDVPEGKAKSSYFIGTLGKHFTELSSGTELLPVRLLGKKARKFVDFTASDGYSYEVPAKWNSKYLARFLEDAKRAGVKVRFHLLLCPEMTPEWFFFRGYDTATHLASKASMTARIEWYIKEVTDFIADWEAKHNQGEPLVSSYDLLAELYTDSGELNKTPHNYLLSIFGDDSYARHAFCFASRCVPEGVKLCYCDHSLFEKKKAERVREFIRSVRSADEHARVDEIGIISHLTADWPERKAFFSACRDFSSLDLDVQIQQLDMLPQSGTDSGSAYYDFMKACVENASVIQGVSFRALAASEETEFVDYMRSPLFSSSYRCTKNFTRVVEASGWEEK